MEGAYGVRGCVCGGACTNTADFVPPRSILRRVGRGVIERISAVSLSLDMRIELLIHLKRWSKAVWWTCGERGLRGDEETAG